MVKVEANIAPAPGLLVIDIVSRDPPESRIIDAFDPCFTDPWVAGKGVEWMTVRIPVCFCRNDCYEVVMRATGKTTGEVNSSAVTFKKSTSSQNLTLCFYDGTVTFDIEYVWQPLAMSAEITYPERDSLELSPQVCWKEN
mgnify:CR=1 FL=1